LRSVSCAGARGTGGSLGKVEMPTPVYEVVFFDLGGTLIEEPPKRTWVPGARATLSSIRGKGFRLGVISNTGTLDRSQLLALLPPDFDLAQFDDRLIVLSSEVGVEKPALKIFRIAVARAGIEPHKCLFCTEDLLHTLAAQQVGMHVARLQKPPNSDVGELPAVLDQLESLAF